MDQHIMEQVIAGQADPGGMVQALLANGEISDSKKQILQMLMAQQQPAEELPGEDLPPPTHQGAGASELNILVQQAARRIDELEDLTTSLAEALGACTLCFGSDQFCQECGGNGGPGHFAPERRAFEFFVLPVINRMKRARKKAGPQPADPEMQQPNTIPELNTIPERSA